MNRDAPRRSLVVTGAGHGLGAHIAAAAAADGWTVGVLDVDGAAATRSAAAIGAAAIIVFIVLAYGLFGVFAAMALVVNVLLIMGVMSMTQATSPFSHFATQCATAPSADPMT